MDFAGPSTGHEHRSHGKIIQVVLVIPWVIQGSLSHSAVGKSMVTNDPFMWGVANPRSQDLGVCLKIGYPKS